MGKEGASGAKPKAAYEEVAQVGAAGAGCTKLAGFGGGVKRERRPSSAGSGGFHVLNGLTDEPSMPNPQQKSRGEGFHDLLRIE